mmetsp:Transcript_23395/g.32686  ORF Transcript_23395/g.32686 Transcript_23395/m.32686 type:complete len:283 (+) Transcript_23395:89-937(+)
MNLLNFSPIESLNETIEKNIDVDVENPFDATTMGTILSFGGTLFVLRYIMDAGVIQARRGERLLRLRALNELIQIKDLFVTYLYCAIFQPMYAIQGYNVEGPELLTTIVNQICIFLWIWLLTDAFNLDEVKRYFKYFVEIRTEAKKDLKRFRWLRFDKKKDNENSTLEWRSFVGSIRVDCSLWIVLMNILAACLPGSITHRHVTHAYMILIFWIVTHHACRRATAWTSGYLVTFFFPSLALMPMEYCLPLVDTIDTVEDLEFIEQYREFVIDQTGVELAVEG